ncbi:MAG TPA: CehA/McbA family metallohydrolase [bacterium]|nr:CehA/McbA family metallohydrolase [bacterium]
MAKADLHLHTDFSDGLHSPRQVVQAASKAGLQIIAVTDHDTLEGARRAKEYAFRRPDLNVQVVVGEEVSTLNGHVIGIFLKEFVPPRLTANRTVDLIHQQGGIAILAHPFHIYTGKDSEHPKAVEMLADIPFDGIETINHGDALSFWSNRKALRIMERHKLAAVGCSDAHNARFIGMGHTEFDGDTSEDLRAALLSRRTKAVYHRSWKMTDILVHLKDAAPVLNRYSKKAALI